MNLNKIKSKCLVILYSSILLSLLVIGLYYSFKINPHSFSWIIATTINIVLALFVYTKNKKNSTNIAFALFSSTIALWSFSVWGLHVASNSSVASNWSRIFSFGMLFIPATFIHFIFAITQKINKNKHSIYLSYLIATIFSLLNVSGLLVRDFVNVGVKYTPKPTILYILWMLNFTIWMAYGLYVLYKTYKTTSNLIEKNQIKFVFIAYAVAVIFAFTNAPLSFGIKIYPIGGLSSIIYTGIVAYAIVKYQLMDIEIIIRKGIVYAALTACVTGGYVLLVGISYAVLGMNRTMHRSLILEGVSASIIAFVVLNFKNRIQDAIDRLFFRDKYDYRKTLATLSDNLSSIFGLDKMLVAVLDTIITTVHIDKGLVLLLNSDKQAFEARYAVNIDSETRKILEIKRDTPFVRSVMDSRHGFIHGENGGDIGDLPGKAGIVLSLPLRIKGKVLGILCLGNKLSEEAYTDEEQELFMTIANQAAVAVENALLYAEMREMEKNIHQADKLASLGALASSVAHEVKNPLVSFKTFVQLIGKKDSNPETIKRLQAVVSNELDRVENILNELLNFSRTPREKLQNVNLGKTINEMLELMQIEILKNHIKVTANYEAGLPDIIGDRDQLKQVFLNIILNAIDVMKDGGNISISAKRDGKSVKISIADTGPGISKEDAVKVFKPFFTTKEKGTGLGLSISRKIIKNHNGKIEIVSPPENEKNGTAFIISIPINFIEDEITTAI